MPFYLVGARYPTDLPGSPLETCVFPAAVGFSSSSSPDATAVFASWTLARHFVGRLSATRRLQLVHPRLTPPTPARLPRPPPPIAPGLLPLRPQGGRRDGRGPGRGSGAGEGGKKTETVVLEVRYAGGGGACARWKGARRSQGSREPGTFERTTGGLVVVELGSTADLSWVRKVRGGGGVGPGAGEEAGWRGRVSARAGPRPRRAEPRGYGQGRRRRRRWRRRRRQWRPASVTLGAAPGRG